MADVSISYNNSEIASMNASGTKTLLTSGTYCEDDIEITYTKPSISTQEISSKDVNFYNYDGTLVYSYSKTEFANLTELPANPINEGFTAQGWNWTLSNAKTYMTTHDRLNIGQSCVTSDGKTRLYVELESGRLSPEMGMGVNGTVDIDWGDDSTHDTLTGTSLTTRKSATHIYNKPGSYVIILTVTGQARFFGVDSVGSYLFVKSSSSNSRNPNRSYTSKVKKIELGSNIAFGDNAFANLCGLETINIPTNITRLSSAFAYCFSLKYITIPINTAIGSYTFRYAYALKTVSIPKLDTVLDTSTFESCYSLQSVQILDDITSIKNNAFNICYSLTNVTIPSNVTTIGSSAFAYCYGLGEIHFKGITPPTVSASNAWTSIPSDCIIYVPKGYLSAYTGATNYPSSSTYTYVEE